MIVHQHLAALREAWKREDRCRGTSGNDPSSDDRPMLVHTAREADLATTGQTDGCANGGSDFRGEAGGGSRDGLHA